MSFSFTPFLRPPTELRSALPWRSHLHSFLNERIPGDPHGHPLDSQSALRTPQASRGSRAATQGRTEHSQTPEPSNPLRLHPRLPPLGLLAISCLILRCDICPERKVMRIDLPTRGSRVCLDTATGHIAQQRALHRQETHLLLPSPAFAVQPHPPELPERFRAPRPG
jgi:hypothetical protein